MNFGHVRRSREARTSIDDRSRAQPRRSELAAFDGAASRTARRTAQGSARCTGSARDQLESIRRCRPWPPWPPALRRLLATCSFVQTMTGRRFPASDTDIAYAPVTRLSRWIERRQLTCRTPHQHLPEPHRAVRLEAAIRHHAHEDARARPGEAGRRRDRRRTLPRAAPRHPLRRQGSAGHGGHRHDLRRRAIQGSRARRGLRGRQAPDRRRRRPHRQVEPGSAGAQRHLVRRPDDESVAD